MISDQLLPPVAVVLPSSQLVLLNIVLRIHLLDVKQDQPAVPMLWTISLSEACLCVSWLVDQVASLHPAGSGPGLERLRTGRGLCGQPLGTKAGTSRLQNCIIHVL